jgi:hypothetical protein
MRQALAERASDVAAINSDAAVYKDQYEALLQEYNVYLEDLGALERKAEGIEERKKAFDEQTAVLQVRLICENSADTLYFTNTITLL